MEGLNSRGCAQFTLMNLFSDNRCVNIIQFLKINFVHIYVCLCTCTFSFGHEICIDAELKMAFS